MIWNSLKFQSYLLCFVVLVECNVRCSFGDVFNSDFFDILFHFLSEITSILFQTNYKDFTSIVRHKTERIPKGISLIILSGFSKFEEIDIQTVFQAIPFCHISLVLTIFQFWKRLSEDKFPLAVTAVIEILKSSPKKFA
jgi:hypothetical protein